MARIFLSLKMVICEPAFEVTSWFFGWMWNMIENGLSHFRPKYFKCQISIVRHFIKHRLCQMDFQCSENWQVQKHQCVEILYIKKKLICYTHMKTTSCHANNQTANELTCGTKIWLKIMRKLTSNQISCKMCKPIRGQDFFSHSKNGHLLSNCRRDKLLFR
mgnify:CR=1 FL=1